MKEERILKMSMPLILDWEPKEGETEDLIAELNNDPEIKEATKEETMGIGEIILIKLITLLIVELLKKSPEAIRKFTKLIQRILKKAGKNSKEGTKPKVVISVKTLTVEFYSGSKEEVEGQLSKIYKIMAI